MRRVLILDRDGTIIREPADEQIDCFSKLKFVAGAITNLARICRELDFELVMLTNQDGLGSASFPEESFWPVQEHIVNVLAGEGVAFADILIDKTFEHEGANTRKPGTGLLGKYIYGDYDLSTSWVVGDRWSDLQLAQNLGCRAIHLLEPDSVLVSKLVPGARPEPELQADVVVSTWNEVYQTLVGSARVGRVLRKTTETEIEAEVNLDGSGRFPIDTGIGFFDHMLTQVAVHGGFDISLKVKGDLQVDEHHTIEDVALGLGMAFDRALGSRRNIKRYSFLLPMDESLATVALDLGGRPWLEWDLQFQREMLGKMPTEMFKHFFKSFCDAARCNLHISCSGENEHHKIEAVFKAFGKVLGAAVKRSLLNAPVSSKGVL